MISEIEDLIKSKMNIVKISIADFSNNHKNHPGNSGGGHYQAVIISDDFKGLSLLERHKKIYSILGDLIHAFSMKTYTSDEFKNLDAQN